MSRWWVIFFDIWREKGILSYIYIYLYITSEPSPSSNRCVSSFNNSSGLLNISEETIKKLCLKAYSKFILYYCQINLSLTVAKLFNNNNEYDANQIQVRHKRQVQFFPWHNDVLFKESPLTLQKLCVFTKFSCQEFRWNFYISHSVMPIFSSYQHYLKSSLSQFFLFLSFVLIKSLFMWI